MRASMRATDRLVSALLIIGLSVLASKAVHAEANAPVQPAGLSISIEAGSSPNPAGAGSVARGSSSSNSGINVGIPPGAGDSLLAGPALHLDIAAQPPFKAADLPRGSSSNSHNSSASSNRSQSHNSGAYKAEELSGSGSTNTSKAPISPSSNITSGTLSSDNTTADTAVAAAALLPLSISSRRRAALSPLIPAVDYYYKSVNGSDDMPLGLPVNPTPGLALTRWVLSAWSISNLSAPAGLVDSTMQRVEQLINNFTRMSPGQVQLSATANVTVPYVFQGMSDWTPAATAAMKLAASDAVGGYDPAYITVLLDPPNFGVKTAAFLDSSPAPVTAVTSNRQVVFYPISGSSKHRHHRKLLQQAVAPAAASVGSNFSTGMPWGVDGPVQHGRTSNQSEWTHVWVSYHRLDPLNVTVLLQSLSAACDSVALSRGADMSATACGQHTQHLLQQAGVQMNAQTHGEFLTNKPMVSVSVRLAVGVTEQQADSNTDMLVAMWLAQPRNIAGAINMSGLPDPVGPNALIKWIVTPEIWGAQVPPSPATSADAVGLKPGTIAGITIGSVAFAALAAGVILLSRRNKQAQLAVKTDTASDTSSRRRRRRRPAKPRYLLPELPPATDEPISAAATSLSSLEAATDHADTSVSDNDPSPDQIRPAMQELGDSVTSAARFELEDGDADVEHGNGSVSGVLGAGGVGSRVLTARQALIAEQQVAAPDVASLSDANLVSRGGGWQPTGTSSAAGALQRPLTRLSSLSYQDSSHASLEAPQGPLSSGADVSPQGRMASPTTPHTSGVALFDAISDATQPQAPLTPPVLAPPSWPYLPSPVCEHESSLHGSSLLLLPVDGNGGDVQREDSMARLKSNVEGAGIVSIKVSKSPFVRSYDFSQLAGELPKDMIVSAPSPCTTSNMRRTSSTSTHELHGIGSTQISVMGDGQYLVVDDMDG